MINGGCNTTYAMGSLHHSLPFAFAELLRDRMKRQLN